MSTLQALRKAQMENLAVIDRTAPAVSETVPAVQAKVWPEMHAGVYWALLGTWAAFMSIFWVTFESSSQELFLLTFITIYAAVFFGLPIWMNRKGQYMPCTLCGFGDFLRGRVATIDGSITGLEALIQVILVPACLAIGGVAIGFIIHASRIVY